MSLVRWTPVFRPARDLVTMQDEVDRFVDSFFRGDSLRGGLISFTPVVDIQETPEEFVVHADLPGLTSKDVKVNLLGDTLTIRGERKEEKKEGAGSALRIERSYGAFERSFTLGAPVRADGVKATYKDGVLEIHVPKAEEARRREIPVQGS